MTGLVAIEDCDSSKSLQCTVSTDLSFRSLESVNDPSCPSASSWRRSFNPLDSLKTERANHLASCQHKEDGTVGSIQLDELNPEHSPKQSMKDSFLVEECSVSTRNCDSWHGLVTIGRDKSGNCGPASPDSRVARKLKYVDISSRTPPRPKKKKEKKEQSRRSSRTSPKSPVIPWGDLAIIHDFNRSVEELGSPGHTPKKTRRKKLQLNSSLDFDSYKDSFDGSVGLWDDLLVAAPIEDTTSHFETSMPNIAPLEPDYLGQVVDPLSTQTLPAVPPFWTQGNDSFLDRFKTLYDASENDNSDLRKDLFRSQDDDENPLSAIAASENEHVASDDLQDKPSKCRLIRFADEQGLPIEKIYQIGDESHFKAMGRIIVLLVDPLVKKFEFLQGEYSSQAGTTVADLLQQLPSFAMEEWFAKLEYESLYGTNDGPRELKSMDRLDQLDLAKREITVAVARGVSGVELVNEAAPIIQNDEINRAVKKAIRVGRGIKYIKSRMEMEVENDADVAVNEFEFCHNDLILPENLGLDSESRDIKDHQSNPRKGRFYPPPFIDLYDNNDHIPRLDNDAVFPDQREVVVYYEADHNQHRVIKFLHASLLATIGIAYSLTTK